MADAGTRLAYEIERRRVTPQAFYAAACDPRRSVSVEACAGAGKTWMLVSRILRALLAGAQPHQVLAITFTRKAAGEMRERLQEWLQDFSGADDAKLLEALLVRGVPAHEAPALVAPLRGLHARLLADGRQVQVRTFHSWFAALLRHAPIAVLEELGLPARHSLLEDDSEAVQKVWRRFHTAVAGDAAARADYEAAVAAHGRFNTAKALQAALDRRIEFTLADRQGVVEASVRPWQDIVPALAVHPSPESLLAGDVALARWMARAWSLAAEANKTPKDAAVAIERAFGLPDLRERHATLRAAFFVKDEDRLKTHLARYGAAQEAEAELQAICRACAQHDAWLHHQRMTRLSRVLLAEFAALKREHGWIDMNDVELAAHRLLSDDVLAGWIQERLDARITHLLVDEFQDTNPLQWQALHAWLSGYAGAGGGTAPSVFLVGDPKQSIYRFRRAEPKVFAAAQAFVANGLAGLRLQCDHTRRNAQAVLETVNRVMGDAQQAGDIAGFRAHTTESGEAGAVLRLPQLERPAASGRQQDEAAGWRDSLSTPREVPEERLITLECRQAARWIAARVAQGCEPGDILVLARRRDRLAAMEDELRALGVATQQPEKTNLADAPEVQDVVALLDALVSPSHDLSLARALKSPVFGCSDDDLVALATLAKARRAQERPTSWFELLREGTGLTPTLQAAAGHLAQWSAAFAAWPPHDALARVFDEGDVLARYAATVPSALREPALANLRALGAAALDLDGGRYATPYAFVRALKGAGVAGPSVVAPGAVRLLTVHGAKGLEAPVVVMLDTDPQATKAESMGVVIDWPGERDEPVRFSFIASESRPPACNTDALAAEQQARHREELHALYVAMTRARQELVVSSVQPRTPDPGSWWQRVSPLCAQADVPAIAVSGTAADGESIELLVVPRLAVAPQPRPVREEDSLASRTGKLLHRLLELHGGGRALDGLPLHQLRRAFDVPAGEATRALAMAQAIAAGEGAWTWDRAQVDWQADEVEIVHGGQVLRLDRLVRHREGTWWVLDHKSAVHPERRPQLLAQLRTYRDAVARAHPGEPVRAAFLTGDGRFVPLP